MQPRTRGADEEAARRTERRNLKRLRDAGFRDPVARWLPLDPPAVCVTAVAAGAEGDSS